MTKKDISRDEFIGQYLDRNMKGHGLPHGMAYYNLLAKKTEAAERKWDRMIDKMLTNWQEKIKEKPDAPDHRQNTDLA